jgi:hypothetical protein
MSACGRISADIISDCAEKPTPGLEVTVWLMNRDDVLEGTVTYDIANRMLITNMVLGGQGNQAYKLVGVKLSNIGRCELVPGDFNSFWRHTLEGRIFKNNADQLLEISNMENSNLVAIVENKYKGTAGSSAFQVYGLDAGLELTVAQRDTDDAETGAAWNVTLASNDNALEKDPIKAFFDTDYATTKGKVVALETPVP